MIEFNLVERDWNRATVRPYATRATALKRPDALLARLLLLVQTVGWQVVSPNFADGDGPKNPKFVPLTVTCTAPLMGNSTFKDAALRSEDVKANADAGMMAFESSGDACHRTLIPTPLVLWLSSMVITYQPKVSPK